MTERKPVRTNPFLDSLHFLIGDTPDHDALGPAKYLLVLLYAALLIGGTAIAVRNFAQDAEQRTARHVCIWLFRMLIGTMWLQGSLWKLPLPVSDGFRYWTTQLTEHSAFAAHAALMKDVFLAHIALLDPAVYLAETGLAISLMLGFAVRLGGLVGVAFTLNLWIGLYRSEGEWPWQYVFIMLTHAFFMMDNAGRSLGLDAMIRRMGAGRLAGPSLLGRAYRLAS
jgi:uncharacterized membrane protein YphA (DoxX/SURF4 family)